MFKFFLLVFVFEGLKFCSNTIILKPDQAKEGLEVGVLFVQGAQIDAKYYVKIHQELQTKFSGRLWIALTEFPLNLPEPLAVNQIIIDSLNELNNSGLAISAQTPFFFIAHSLGGIVIQEYLLNESNQKNLPVKFAGLVLEGSYIERKNYQVVKKQNANPTYSILSIGGDLDGLNRISRMSEAFYFDKLNKNELAPYNRMTLILSGINHYQFAGDGTPPSNVKSNDIKSEKSDLQARQEIATVISAFMSVSLNNQTTSDIDLLNLYQEKTINLVEPLIQGFELEGSYHLNSPCYLNTSMNCTRGSPWSSISQQIMGSSNVSMIVQDEFYSEYKDDRLPYIHNNCIQPYSCVLNVTTTSQLDYSIIDSYDLALYPVAARFIFVSLI